MPFEILFWCGVLGAAGWLWLNQHDGGTTAMLLLVWLAFTVFTGFAYRYAWTIRRAVPVPEDALRRAASTRTVTVGGVERLPLDAVEAVLSVTDADAPPSWLGLGQNVLVSLGLAGTFLGLTLGIYSAAEGILSPNPDEVQQAMGVLMGGAKLAFVKSLAGVVGAMIWSFRHGSLEDGWAERRARARAWLDETFPPLSSERLLALTLAHLEATAAAHAAGQAVLRNEVVTAGTTLASMLPRLDRVEQTLTTRLTAVEEALRAPDEDDVVTTLGSLRNTMSQLADTMVGKIGSPIAQGVSSALAVALLPKLDELSKGVHALHESRGGLEQRVGEQVSGQVTELGGALAALQGAVVTLKEQLLALPSQVHSGVRDGTEAASRSLSRDLVDAGQRVAERLSGAAADLATGSASITLSVGDLRVALGESTKVAEALRDAGETTAASLIGVQTPLDEAAAQVTAAHLALAASTVSVSQAATAFQATATTLAEAEPALREAWRAEREAASRLLDATRAAEEPAASLAAQLEALRAGCADLVTVIKRSGADHVMATDEAGGRLADALARFEAGLGAITQSLDSQSGKLFQDAALRAAEAAELVGKALQGGAAGFEASMDRMVERSASLERLFTRLDALTHGLAEQQAALAAGLTTAAAPLERAGASLSAAAPALEAARKSLESEQAGLTGLAETLKGSAAAVQSILLDTQKVRAILDSEVPARLAEIERTREELERAWEKAGLERDRAWTDSARRLTDSVRGLERANADIARAWETAEQARTAGLDQNAREIALYAEKVNQAIRLPQRLTALNQTVDDLVAVLDELKRSARGPA